MSIADSIIGLVTGQSTAELSADVQAAQQQITLAIETMITLQLVADILLFMLVLKTFRDK